MRIILFSVLICFAVSSCITNQKQASRRVAKLIEKFPGIIDTTKKKTSDTNITKEFVKAVINDTSKQKEVSDYTDSLLNELAKKCPNINKDIPDSIQPFEIAKKEIKKNITIEHLMSPFSYDSAGVKAKVWAKGNKININLELPKTTINNKVETTIVPPCPKCPDNEEIGFMRALWKVKWVLASLIGIILLLLFVIVIMK